MPDRLVEETTGPMASLKGSKTEENLRAAFARESEAKLRYLYFAEQADVEGHPSVAALFRAIAQGETSHAFGHLEFLTDIGDPATGEPMGDTEQNLRSAIAGERYDHEQLYPSYAATARSEGFDEIGDWMETLAEAERAQAERFSEGLETLG